MSGVVSGGWGYVAAAWGVSLALLATYALLISIKLKHTARQAKHAAPADKDNVDG